MASCVRNIYSKNYENPIIFLQVRTENVWDVFLRHSVDSSCFFDYSLTECTTDSLKIYKLELDQSEKIFFSSGIVNEWNLRSNSDLLTQTVTET